MIHDSPWDDEWDELLKDITIEDERDTMCIGNITIYDGNYPTDVVGYKVVQVKGERLFSGDLGTELQFGVNVDKRTELWIDNMYPPGFHVFTNLFSAKSYKSLTWKSAPEAIVSVSIKKEDIVASGTQMWDDKPDTVVAKKINILSFVEE